MSAGSAVCGVSAGLYLIAGHGFDALWFSALGVMLVGFMICPGVRGHNGGFVKLNTGILVASLWLSTLAAFGRGWSGETWVWLWSLATAFWLTPFAGYSWRYIDFSRFIMGLAPFAIIEMLAILIEFYATPWVRVDGVMENANPAGFLMALSCAALLWHRRRWLSLPFLVALMFTGSRWAFVALVAALAVMIYKRRLTGRHTAVLVISALLIALPTIHKIDAGFFRMPEMWKVETRIAKPAQEVSLIPYAPTEHTPYIAPVRVFNEAGVVGAFSWLALSLMGLWRARRLRNVESLLLLMLLIMAVMESYIWIGAFAWAWWALIAAAHSRPISPADSLAPASPEALYPVRRPRVS